MKGWWIKQVIDTDDHTSYILMYKHIRIEFFEFQQLDKIEKMVEQLNPIFHNKMFQENNNG